MGAVAATVLAVPGIAQARLSWSAAFAIDLNGSPAFSGVACSSGTQCTAVSGLAEVTFDPAAPARASGAQIDYGTDSDSNQVTISAVACPSGEQCTAVDSGGQEVTFNPAAPGHPKPVWIDGYQDRDIFSVPLDAIVCPSTTRCIAVDQNGGEVTFNPHHPVAFNPNNGNDTSVTVDADDNALNAFACSSTTQCTAVDSGGQEVTFNPNGRGTPTSGILDASNTTLNAVACPSSTQCTTVDNAGLELTFNPLSPPANPVLKPLDPSGKSLNVLTCASVAQCTAVDAVGRQLTFDPATGALLATATVDASSAPTGLACPLATACTAVDQNGGEAAFRPLSSATVSTTDVYNGRFSAQHALGAVACPSADECVAFDDAGSEVMFHPQTPAKTPTIGPIDPNGNGVNGLACEWQGSCTVVDSVGRQITFDPGSPVGARPVRIDGTGDLSAVACPSASQCTALDSGSLQAITFDPTAPIVKPSHFRIDKGVANEINAIACPSVTQCTAVDTYQGQVTFDPRSEKIIASATLNVDQALGTVSCPSTTMCVTLDSLGNVLTFDPRSRAHGSSIAIDTHAKNGMGPITCPTTSFCVADDPIGGYLVEGDPALGGGWTLIPLAGQSPNDVACLSRSECVAVDSTGYALLGPASVTTGSGGRATGFGAGNAALSFTLTAAAGAPAIRSIELPSSRGIGFSSSAAVLRAGVSAGSGTHKLRFTAGVRKGVLTVALAAATPSVRISISSGALAPSSRLAYAVRTGRQTVVGVSVVAVDAHHAATDLTLDTPAS